MLTCQVAVPLALKRLQTSTGWAHGRCPLPAWPAVARAPPRPRSDGRPRGSSCPPALTALGVSAPRPQGASGRPCPSVHAFAGRRARPRPGGRGRGLGRGWPRARGVWRRAAASGPRGWPLPGRGVGSPRPASTRGTKLRTCLSLPASGLGSVSALLGRTRFVSERRTRLVLLHLPPASALPLRALPASCPAQSAVLWARPPAGTGSGASRAGAEGQQGAGRRGLLPALDHPGCTGREFGPPLPAPRPSR